MPSSSSSQESGAKSRHDFNPRSGSPRYRVMLLVMLIMFLCFVVLDPWKVLKVEMLPGFTKSQPSAPPGRPDFSEIKIKGRLRPIHNAVLKEIRKDGLIFLAQEGLVKAPFKDLDPEFARYYLYISGLRKERASATLLSGVPTVDTTKQPLAAETSGPPRS